MSSLLDVVLSAVGLVGAATGRGETETEETGETSLFACPRCHSVYIAAEKETCSACDCAVEQVPATLERVE